MTDSGTHSARARLARPFPWREAPLRSSSVRFSHCLLDSALQLPPHQAHRPTAGHLASWGGGRGVGSGIFEKPRNPVCERGWLCPAKALKWSGLLSPTSRGCLWTLGPVVRGHVSPVGLWSKHVCRRCFLSLKGRDICKAEHTTWYVKGKRDNPWGC